MKRKIHRAEMRETVVNLIDLGFTPRAISAMLNKTEANIYAHLKAAHRLKDRKITRKKPVEIDPASKAAMRKVFATPDVHGGAMLVLAWARDGE